MVKVNLDDAYWGHKGIQGREEEGKLQSKGSIFLAAYPSYYASLVHSGHWSSNETLSMVFHQGIMLQSMVVLLTYLVHGVLPEY
jgi:hypothetical protein